MITAFVGIYDDSNELGCLRGNGKTCSMVYYLHQDFLEGRKVFSNFYTTFSKQMPTQQILEIIKAEKLTNISVAITETQQVLNSLGSSQQAVKFISEWVSQTRKNDTDLYFDCQRFNDVHIRLRKQTDIILRPEKYHADGNICNFDRCSQKHYISIFAEKPFREKAITGDKYIDASEVGKMYDTNQIVYDEIIVKKAH